MSLIICRANPGKFQAIMLGGKGHELCTEIKIEDFQIKCEDHVKLLGVDIDYLLNLDIHISNLCSKAAKQINVLLRLKQYLTAEVKLLIYRWFIWSNFNYRYCPLVWHFCSKNSMNKLEKLQYRALKIVYNAFENSYEKLLQKSNLSTLHIHRIRLIAIEAFKILNQMLPAYTHDLIHFKVTKYSFRYENLANVPRVNTSTYGKASFRYEAAQVWNSLPIELRKISNFNDFKGLVHTWCGSSCKCSLCKFTGDT